MKKLMIALAAVAMAAGVHAATYNWKWSVSGTSPLAKPGTTGTSASDFLTSGTAYLFAGLTSVQLSTIVSDFAGGSYTASGYEKSSAVVSGGTITSVDFDDTRSSGTSVDWYMVVTTTIDDHDYLFISDALTKSRQADGKTTKIAFSALSTSATAALDASSGYSAAGWYTAVPEPTSGLLLLLGMAGIALKRKRA